MTCTLKNKDTGETREFHDALELCVLSDSITGYDTHCIIFKQVGFYVFNCTVWELIEEDNDFCDFPEYDKIFSSVRAFLRDNPYLNSFRYSSAFYLYSELDSNQDKPKNKPQDNHIYHIEAVNKSNSVSCKFEEDDIISIDFVRSPGFIKPEFCLILLKSDVEIRFQVRTWDIYQYSNDGYLFVNGSCVSEPLTQEELGIGMIDVMNGDGYYDEDGNFHSYYNYDD